MELLEYAASGANVLLAGAAYWQMLALKSDQRRTRRREAADRVYSKTLSTLEAWSSQGYLNADYQIPWWSMAKREAGPVAYQLPKNIQQELERLDEVGKQTIRTRSPARYVFVKLLDDHAQPYKQRHGQTGAKDVTILTCIVESHAGASAFGDVDLLSCWLNRMSIDDWARKNLEPLGRTDWRFQLLVGGFEMGDSQDSRNLTSKVFAEMDKTPEGQAYRAATENIQSQAAEVMSVLRREIRKT